MEIQLFRKEKGEKKEGRKEERKIAKKYVDSRALSPCGVTCDCDSGTNRKLEARRRCSFKISCHTT